MHPSYTIRAIALTILCLALTIAAYGQSPISNQTSKFVSPPVLSSASTSVEDSSAKDEVQRQLREQQLEMERMRTMLAEQSRVIDELRRRVEVTERAVATNVEKTNVTNGSSSTVTVAVVAPDETPAKQTSDQDARISKVEEQTRKNSEILAKQLGSLTFSGDVRLRYESFYGLLNPTANGDNPAILGNPLTTRQGFRVRVRFGVRGQISKEFDWGFRLSSGSFASSISTNQTLTDFFNRKPFGIDQAYLTWTPSRIPGLRLQGGKFDIPWVRTELTIDNDIQLEGFNETYSRSFKSSALKNITLVAWQSPMLERNSAFVKNPNGTVNVDESKRGGRDLALYGAQARARFELSPKVALTVSAADLYYSGTQFISPIQVFGANLLVPITITIPATATTPAQTITTQVSIPRDFLVAGNANLGISTATNNSVNRDGRLSSGFNLVDIMGRLDFTHSQRFPIALIFDFVTNTQTHDVVLAGPNGANVFLENNENNGYYAEIQAGRQKEKGDLQFGYTYFRIEKDAVLTPFNFSDIIQQSDVRAHRFIFNYTADPRVIISVTGIISQRPNGLLGAFGVTPPGSLNRATNRLQVDTTFRF